MKGNAEKKPTAPDPGHLAVCSTHDTAEDHCHSAGLELHKSVAEAVVDLYCLVLVGV